MEYKMAGSIARDYIILEDLSKSICVGAEIFERKDDGSCEHIGFVSRKVLVSICIEQIKNALEITEDKHLKHWAIKRTDLVELSTFLEDANKWLEEDIEFDFEERYDFESSTNHNISYCPIILMAIDTMSVMRGSQDGYMCDFYLSNSFLRSKREIEDECIKQGEEILRFFKSNKYLFCL